MDVRVHCGGKSWYAKVRCPVYADVFALHQELSFTLDPEHNVPIPQDIDPAAPLRIALLPCGYTLAHPGSVQLAEAAIAQYLKVLSADQWKAITFDTWWQLPEETKSHIRKINAECQGDTNEQSQGDTRDARPDDPPSHA